MHQTSNRHSNGVTAPGRLWRTCPDPFRVNLIDARRQLYSAPYGMWSLTAPIDWTGRRGVWAWNVWWCKSCRCYSYIFSIFMYYLIFGIPHSKHMIWFTAVHICVPAFYTSCHDLHSHIITKHGWNNWRRLFRQTCWHVGAWQQWLEALFMFALQTATDLCASSANPRRSFPIDTRTQAEQQFSAPLTRRSRWLVTLVCR